MDEHGGMIRNCVAYTDQGGRGPDIDLAAVSDVLERGKGFVWVGLHEPDEPLLESLQAEFGLHDLAVEDAHNAHQRPKIESYGESLFIAVHTAQLVDGHIRFGETHIFLGRAYLLTVRHGASASYAPARARCEREAELLALGPSYGLYAVLDLIVDNLMPIVDAFQGQLRELEDDIFGDTQGRSRGTIQRLYRLKRELVSLRLAVTPLQDILNQLVRFHPTLIRDEVRVYFRDVYDHAVRINESVSTLSEMLSAALSVNLALVSVNQGEVVKRLAGWAALLAVPTLVASWYGMNFAHMPELGGRYSYYLMLGATGLAMGVVFALLKRARWL
ncbi:magnesium and cobalt transport protein CorA [Pseudomarimonas salicorniae]|uniref:Magnesium and cobalt transport protein CorA n=1 Tax=Pseudomarimonas salicorniae TaxID=2933270 RepID=A0ABT0GDI6_9GAMM|nr:magnesium and cobalt transport protein CorA [Lysobacter sp. CAU 1642]MCK7592609.1 magnesium and cobalt transport protein CorA [Lysobacter sp. CAU 1642]